MLGLLILALFVLFFVIIPAYLMLGGLFVLFSPGAYVEPTDQAGDDA